MFLLYFFCTVLAREIVSPGEEIEGAKLLKTKKHEEFIRYQFLLPSKEELWVEIQKKSDHGNGACSSDLYTLYPRWELLKKSISKEEQPPLIQELCRRLQQDVQDRSFSEQILLTSRKKTPQNIIVSDPESILSVIWWGGISFAVLWFGRMAVTSRKED